MCELDYLNQIGDKERGLLNAVNCLQISYEARNYLRQ